MSWDQEEQWTLRSPQGTSEREFYDFEKDVCRSTVSSLVLVPQKMSFFDGSYVCTKLSGSIVEYVQRNRFQEITHFLAGRGQTSTSQCTTTWNEDDRAVEAYLGGTDNKEEGKWRTWVHDEEIFHLPWAPNRPTNNGILDNCMILAARSKEVGRPMLKIDEGETDIIDENCLSKACVVCEVPAPVPVLTLRGLCPETKFNRNYIFRLTDSGELEYTSEYTSSISYDKDSEIWVLRDIKDPGSSAVSSAVESSLLLGEQIFDFRGVKDDQCTTGLDSKKVKVKLSSCKEGQFTCSDGWCVGMRQRCDQLVHCRDASDEQDCGILALEKSYNRKVPPIISINTTTFSPTQVEISLVLLKVVSINEVKHNIEFQFSAELRWRENRALFHNLKQDTSLNSLSDEEIAKLWLPLVIYDNTDQKESTRLSAREADLQWTTTVTINKEGNFTRSGLEEAHEAEVFQGSENRLVMEQTYTKEFQCLYQLQRYPFDTQVCTIVMSVSVMEKKTMMLRPVQMLLKSQTELTQYVITKWSLESDLKGGVRMVVVFKRRIINDLLTTYLPSFLLILTTYATTFFKPFYFEAAVTVNLTTMLVMTTIFTSVMDKLPPTAYVKMVDIWLIFGQLIPFIETVLLTAMEYLRDTDGINHHGSTRIVEDDKVPLTTPVSVILMVHIFII